MLALILEMSNVHSLNEGESRVVLHLLKVGARPRPERVCDDDCIALLQEQCYEMCADEASPLYKQFISYYIIFCNIVTTYTSDEDAMRRFR